MSKQKSQMISALRQLVPPDAVVDVGIGMGNGEVHQWRNWKVPLALIVDVESERVQWTQDWLERYKGWQLATVLLAESTKQQNFFTFFNQSESGVIAVEQVQQIWPNIQLKEQRELQTRRLRDLLSSPSSQALQEASCIWGIIDCLPALPILKGAGDELKKWSVLWVRVVLHDVFPDSKQQDLSSLAEVSNFLTTLGYRCIEVIEENHPALGYALFVQDWHKQYEKLSLENIRLKDVQLQQINGLQTKQIKDDKTQIVNLKQQCQQYENQLEDYKTQIVKLKQRCQKQQIHSNQLEEYKKQIVELQQQLQERDDHQKLLDDEFTKAEAQIELIKDLLLKDEVFS